MKLRPAILFVLVLTIYACAREEIQNSPATISGITPAQLSIGQQGVETKIHGNNFSGVTAVNFGDGIVVDHFSAATSNEISVLVSVSNSAVPGSRTISITTPSGTATAGNALTIINNTAPKAKFTVHPPIGSTATEFNLNAGPSTDPDGSIKNYHWDFADGSSSNGKQVKHKWSSVGKFNVNLTVTDNDNASNFATREIEILADAPPVAVVKVSPSTSGGTQTEFQFDGRESYDPEGQQITSYLWDFGDGTRKENGAIVSHKYKNEGLYTVTLSVTDDKGLTGTIDKPVTIQKFAETQCTGGKTGKYPDIMIDILEASGKEIIVRPKNQNNASCSSIYYKCGDVRQGGITIPDEVWYGIICEMWDRHDGTFRIRLGGGDGPVDHAAPETYLHSATCSAYYYDLYCN